MGSTTELNHHQRKNKWVERKNIWDEGGRVAVFTINVGDKPEHHTPHAND